MASELSDETTDLICDLWLFATGVPWEEGTREEAYAGGETLGKLYDRILEALTPPGPVQRADEEVTDAST